MKAQNATPPGFSNILLVPSPDEGRRELCLVLKPIMALAETWYKLRNSVKKKEKTTLRKKFEETFKLEKPRNVCAF